MAKRQVIEARTAGEQVKMSLTWTGKGYVLVGYFGLNRYELLVERPHPLVRDELHLLLRQVARNVEQMLPLSD